MPTTIIQLVLQRYWRFSRGLLLSVAALVRDAEGRVLLCREAAAATPEWRLPRGDVLSGEDVEAAMQRILAACGLPASTDRATAFAIYADQSRSHAEHVTLLTARLPTLRTSPIRGSREWQMFAVDDLPAVIDPPSRRRIEEVTGLREVAEFW